MAKKKKQPRRMIRLGETAMAVGQSQTSVTLSRGFTITVNGLFVEGTPAFEQWQELSLMLRTAERSIQFAIGDFINTAEERLGEQASQLIDYSEGWSETTCRVYSWMASRIAPERRRMDRLTIKHHQLVAALAPQQQEKWLNRAAADDEAMPWTSARLAAALKEGEDLPPTSLWVLVGVKSIVEQLRFQEEMEALGRPCKAVTRRGALPEADIEDVEVNTDHALPAHEE